MPVSLPRLALLGALLFPVAAWAAELRLELPGGTQTWSSEELLRHPQAAGWISRRTSPTAGACATAPYHWRPC